MFFFGLHFAPLLRARQPRRAKINGRTTTTTYLFLYRVDFASKPVLRPK